jgi:hypothetical protein
MKEGTCPKCGSKNVMAGIEVRDDGRSNNHPLRVVVEEPEPERHAAIWVQGQSTGNITAWVCALRVHRALCRQTHCALEIVSAE